MAFDQSGITQIPALSHSNSLFIIIICYGNTTVATGHATVKWTKCRLRNGNHTNNKELKGGGREGGRGGKEGGEGREGREGGRGGEGGEGGEGGRGGREGRNEGRLRDVEWKEGPLPIIKKEAVKDPFLWKY